MFASDRGLAGAFNANVLRASEELATLLQSQIDTLEEPDPSEDPLIVDEGAPFIASSRTYKGQRYADLTPRPWIQYLLRLVSKPPQNKPVPLR